MKRPDGKLTYEESLQLFVQDFGDDIIKLLPLEKRIQGLDPVQRLQGLTAEQIVTGLSQKQLLANLSLEERKVVLEKLLQSLIATVAEQKGEPVPAT